MLLAQNLDLMECITCSQALTFPEGKRQKSHSAVSFPPPPFVILYVQRSSHHQSPTLLAESSARVEMRVKIENKNEVDIKMETGAEIEIDIDSKTEMDIEKRRNGGFWRATKKRLHIFPNPETVDGLVITSRRYDRWIPYSHDATTTTIGSDVPSQTPILSNSTTTSTVDAAMTKRAVHDVTALPLSAEPVVASMTAVHQDHQHEKRETKNSVELTALPVAAIEQSSIIPVNITTPSTTSAISVETIIKTEISIRTEVPSNFVTVVTKCGHRGKHCNQVTITKPTPPKTVTVTEAAETDMVREWNDCRPEAISTSIYPELLASYTKQRLHHGGLCDLLPWACWFYGHPWTKKDPHVHTIFRPAYSTTVVDATISGTPVHTTITCREHAGLGGNYDHIFRTSRLSWASTHIVTAEYTRFLNAPNYTLPALEARAMETGATPAATVPQLPMATAETFDIVDASDANFTSHTPRSTESVLEPAKCWLAIPFLVLLVFVMTVVFGSINVAYRQRNRPVMRQRRELAEKA